MTMMMIMLITSLFGRLELRAPSSGLRDVSTSITYVLTNRRHWGVGTSSLWAGSTRSMSTNSSRCSGAPHPYC
jgi:hypothetical protein